MNSNRKTAGFVGALFLTAMAASLLGGGLVESVISAPNHPLVTAENETLLIVGMLLELVNAIAVVGIATLMFPIMKRHNETMAVGYLGFRLVEAVFCSMIVIAPLSLMTLSREYLKARISDIQFQAAGILAVTERASMANLLILIFFCVGAFFTLLPVISSETPAAIYISLGIGRCRIGVDNKPAVIENRDWHGNKHDFCASHHLE